MRGHLTNMQVKSVDPIFVYLGANAHQELEQQLVLLYPEIKFIESAIYPERSHSQIEDKSLEDVTIKFDSDLYVGSGKIRFTPINDYNQLNVIESIMSDKHLSLLWTRFNTKTRWRNRSEVKRYEVTYSLIKSALETCSTMKPIAVVFSYEPHMLPMYIFKKVCEALSLRTFTMTISPFSWKVFLDVTSGDDVQHHKRHELSDNSLIKFIHEKKSDYSVAKPFYEKRAVNFGLRKLFKYKLKVNGWRLHKLIVTQIAFANYQKVTTKRNEFQGGKYICVFLQFQPEQTTLPDGRLFAHHLFAIQMLYSAICSLGISLIIREHPATFNSAYNLKWRPGDFISAIKDIGPNIYFDSIYEDPYSLIKNSIAVASITGTVLLEGLLQGRPVIAFGKHPLNGYSATSFVDNFANEIELREKILAAITEPSQVIVSEFEDFLHKIYPTTFGPCEYVGNEHMSLDKLREARYIALRQVVEWLTKKNAIC